MNRNSLKITKKTEYQRNWRKKLKRVQSLDPTRKSLRIPKPKKFFDDSQSTEPQSCIAEEFSHMQENNYTPEISLEMPVLHSEPDPEASDQFHEANLDFSNDELDQPEHTFDYEDENSDFEFFDDDEFDDCENPNQFEEFQRNNLPNFDSIVQILQYVALIVNLPHAAVDLLSRSLSQLFMRLKMITKPFPLARTILKTPRKAAKFIREYFEGPTKIGRYAYLGLAEGLRSVLKMYPAKYLPDGIIELDFFFDGFAPYKNGSHIKTMWPLMCRVILKGIDREKCPIFLVAIFGGEKEPSTSRFLQEFVDEFNAIHTEFEFDGKIYTLKIAMFLGDMPGRALLCGYAGHAGLNSCPKCHQKAKKTETSYGSTVTWYENQTKAPRTDQEYREMSDKSFHRVFEIEEVPVYQLEDFDFTVNVVICSLHAWLLGIVRRHIELLMLLVDKKLMDLLVVYMDEVFSKYPQEFTRAGRYIKEYKRYKGNELKAFVKHWGWLVHKFLADNEQERPRDRRRTNQQPFRGKLQRMLNAFEKLHAATRILYSDELCNDHSKIDDARLWIEKYFAELKEIFGDKAYTNPNSHQALHLVDQCKIHGSFGKCDGASFENYINSVKYLLRFNNREMEQIVNRSIEKHQLILFRIPVDWYILKHVSKDGTMADSIIIDSRTIHCNNKDCFVLTHSRHLCKVLKFFKFGQIHHAAVQLFEKRILESAYDQPALSQEYDYYFVKHLSSATSVECKIPVSEFNYKMACFPYDTETDSYIFSSLSKLNHPSNN